eukprot:Opistho-2@409
MDYFAAVGGYVKAILTNSDYLIDPDETNEDLIRRFYTPKYGEDSVQCEATAEILIPPPTLEALLQQWSSAFDSILAIPLWTDLDANCPDESTSAAIASCLSTNAIHFSNSDLLEMLTK